MQIRKLLPLALAFTILFGTLAANAQGPVASTGKTHHVVFGMTSADEADWRLTVNNIRNLIKGFGEDPYEVEIVAYGPGIAFVHKPSAADEGIQELLGKKVKVVACQNAMRGAHMTAEDLVTGVGQVPAGIVEVVTKQEQGWVYIKAGR
jgi:intracellular sulfur oxidation DsrE/DsrF family protein